MAGRPAPAGLLRALLAVAIAVTSLDGAVILGGGALRPAAAAAASRLPGRVPLIDPPPAVASAAVPTTTAPPAPAPDATPRPSAADLETAALARIHYRWQQLGYRIEFDGPRGGLRGQTFPSLHLIQIYVSGDEPVVLLAHVIAHEIGHAVDFTYGDDGRHQRWLDARDISGATPWYGCSGCADFATPAGDFAETFAYWQIGDADYSRLAPPPGPDQWSALVPLFQPPAGPPPPSTSTSAPPTTAAAPGPVLCLGAGCHGR